MQPIDWFLHFFYFIVTEDTDFQIFNSFDSLNNFSLHRLGSLLITIVPVFTLDIIKSNYSFS